MTRVLFVDDEPRILEGLQRMLRPYRKRWEMAFANSGSQALEMLAAGPYDVIVSDMRMPGMDGAKLLELVRDRYPGVIRIVLSGQFETEAAMRVVPVAHQFLTKPCDPEKLQAVIERFGECEKMVDDDATRRLIAAIGELPALPHTYSTLMEALTDPNVSLDQVGAIVESDLAVAAKVLQLVNSAFFGLSREVTTIATAVGYLGFDVLRQLVMAVELFRTFSPDCRVAGFSMEEIQRHSRCVAAIAARLPIAAEKPAPTSVASLLHDIGKLVLATRLPETFERALQASIVQKRPLFLIEEEMTGTTHAQVGGYLLALWGLPASIVAAVSHHHRPVCTSPDQTVDMSMAVHLADMLAHNAASGIDEPLSLGDEIAAALKPWNDDVPTWQSMASDAVEREVRCLERGL